MSVTIHTTSRGVEFVRTPDACFAGLPDFPYEPHYVDLDGLRMHYVDEGPRTGQVIVLLHGQPDWSYLYRKMIPVLVNAGYRVIAPDMIGMGRSDKPTNIHTHTVNAHAAWWSLMIEALELRDITLFAQDWGGFTGLTVVARRPERFRRVMISNSALWLMPEPILDVPQGIKREDHPVDPDAKIRTFDHFAADCNAKGLMKEDMSEFFHAWMLYALTGPELKPSGNLRRDFGGLTLTDHEARAYDAPFPSEIYMTGVRTLPSMGSLIDERQNLQDWGALKQFEKPFLTVFGDFDNLVGTEKTQKTLIENIPGAAGMPHDRLPAGHFIQETQGPELAKRLADFMVAT
ncbi:MAG: haloalkane dehalogenase [Pseudomonadaceae bacterium]|nr:haloalkane dehalogenase [Pseudomonadaceae bacterium]